MKQIAFYYIETTENGDLSFAQFDTLEAAIEKAKELSLHEKWEIPVFKKFNDYNEPRIVCIAENGEARMTDERKVTEYYITDEEDDYVHGCFEDLDEAKEAAKDYAREHHEASLYAIYEDGRERLVAWYKAKGSMYRPCIFEYEEKEEEEEEE